MTDGWPAWVIDCTSHTLRAEVGSAAYERGLGYARQRRVQTIESDGNVLISSVTGSGRHVYQQAISARQLGAGRTSISGLCSCPLSAGCKHVAATLITARDLALQDAPAPAPAWRTQLSELIAPVVERDTLIVGLQLEAASGPNGLGGSEPIMRVRPVIPGKTGKWIKTGFSWNDVEYGYRHTPLPPEHGELLRAMLMTYRAGQRYYSGDIRMTLKDLGPSAWQLLKRAEQAGIALVSSRSDQPVRLMEPATLFLNVSRQEDSPVSLVPVLRLAAGEDTSLGEVKLLGSPAHGAFVDAEALTLIPFDAPLDKAVHSLLKTGGVSIPDEDLTLFVSTYYPAIRQRVTVLSVDGSVELPEVQPPYLLLKVVYGAKHQTDLAWSIAYPVGDQVIEVVGPDSPVARNRKAEQLLMNQLPSAPGLYVGPTGDHHLVPSTRLTGMATALFVRDDLPALLDLDGVVHVEISGEPAPYEESSDAPLIRVGTTDSEVVDWFDLTISVSVAGQEVPLADLIGALAFDEKQLLLASGTWFHLDRPELSALHRIVEEARTLQDRESDPLRLSPFHAGLWEELVELGVIEEQSSRWTATVGSLLSLEQLPKPPVPEGLKAKLRPYQVEGFHWLSLLWDHQLGGILADDMGLGKTVQTLAMVERAREQGTLGGTAGPLLVVCPTSVVGAWASEAAKFAPGLSVAAISETAAKSGRKLNDIVDGADLVVTSYALFRIDNEAYEGLSWCGLVLDEAQFVKNHQALTYQCARRLPAPFKLAITGTPLENSLMDLWSMLSITAPGLFPNPQRFTELYRRPIESGSDPEMLAILRRRIRPLLLRRTKELVAKDLPPKVEQVLSIPLNPQHRKVYDKHLARERQRILGLLDDLQKNRITILTALTTLRQLSLDASLVDDAHAGKIRSSKIEALMEQLPEVIAEGHRVLVFSQFTRFLGLVRNRLTEDGIEHVYLDGRTRNRPARIAEFTEGSAPVFLISLKAGGVGLTLTEADYVYVLDPWWNPAVEAQAVDRTHRIGQDKTVMVYRLVAQDTIEEKVVALQLKKRDLFAQVVDDEAMAGSVLTAEDIRGLFT